MKLPRVFTPERKLREKGIHGRKPILKNPTTITVTVEADVKEQLQRIAQQEGVKLSTLVREILTDYVKTKIRGV